MKIGVVFPQTEIGPDPAVVRAYVEAAEGAGFDYLLAYDHVLGAGLANRPGWNGPYHSGSQFHEVLVLFGWMSGFTTTLGLVTGVLILPQRQTALVAKQAAEVDVLSGGRLRLGIGVGWNEVEYVGLNEDFGNRGKRSEEQMEVLRALWTEEIVDFKGRWHTIPEAGINPLPGPEGAPRPIPLWIGGYADATMERIGRIADGWFPRGLPGDEMARWREIVNESAVKAGRDPSSIGLDGRITLTPGQEERWLEQTESFRGFGATHMAVNTMGAGRSPQEHIETILRYRELVPRV